VYLLFEEVSLHAALFFLIKNTVTINIVSRKHGLDLTISIATAVKI
jgi:cell division protein FtsX